MPKTRSVRQKKKRFHGNRYTRRRELESSSSSTSATKQKESSFLLGDSSLNGCATVTCIDTGKVLDTEILSSHCRICNGKKPNISQEKHVCSNFARSSGNMEPVSVFRMFERSKHLQILQYSEYYGDGDSKVFETVKNIYGKDSVTKLECIGHVQKRVGGRLWKLKKNIKSLRGKGKLTNKLINK
ncbi:uncharacterized protein TNCV_3391421 [Trichonephila clavipes]|nr:uncharacterized protein TNCV_3391421 [Trichonephila clavipes]